MRGKADWILYGLLLSPILLFTGCPLPTVVTEYNLPIQNLSMKPDKGLSRVVFFNTSNALMYGVDQTGRITIKINDKGLATLDIDSYVQIFLEKGEYDIYLAHRDFILFENKYKLIIDKDELFVEVFAEPVSNNYKLVEQLPADFSRRFFSASIRRK
jgi:hypothetical protein